MPVTAQDIREALKAIRLPAGGQSLPDSGRLSQIVIEGERVAFSIAIDQTEAQAMASVREAAQQCVEAMPGVSRALVSLTADRPAGESGDAPAAAQPLREPGNRKTPSPNARAQKIEGVKHVVAVASGKGGVGKSTTACNIALGLAALGLRVGVMDADIYGPSMPKLFGLSGKPKAGPDRKIVPLENYGVKVMSIGFMVDEETPMIWRGPMVMSAITQMLREVNWGDLDVMIVDMPPGTGDAQLTMAQATPLSGAVIVSTPQDLALLDARRGVAMFQRTEIPVLGIVENMATYICPNCGHVEHIFGHGGARDEAEKLGVPFLGEVPLNMAIRETSDAGRPVTALQPDGPFATVYRGIAGALWENLESGGFRREAPAIVFE
ncbi:MAG: ATP-binding protein involved in chromosome partitioning [Saliniramus fredricksonii]|uniref:Iron-sulfur cluster carrier protein n=1 Tax=Saliniramus fredricksonii TaxID=1653334 RepID=A0A0P7XBG6_9HYPH|nr:Mrp/NBP35 family ATP-binding protein [Saliniramus fredricksonii]KPQ12611.1 MAG: ATP-binding protein involved in chromosome partitioning [Saliniramus fredricksonii]SCC82714.1 ATP-binding protein involved in chromosome partitioning [Saliniramus fredricksonii]